MKAVVIRNPASLDSLELTELGEAAAPGPGEIRVRLHASSLNFHDYAVANGTIPTDDGRIPMSDAAGVVEAVGGGVSEFAEGDQVISVFFPYWQDGVPPHGDFSHVPGDGLDGYARECVVRPASWFTHAPRGYSHLEAATLPCAALTAWRALVVDGGVKPGDSVLILGTGGVAVFALQFAKMLGATAVVTSSSDAKLERARALGADHTINYRSEPEWGKAVSKWSSGRGVDQVLEIGGPGTLPQSIRAVRIGGQISLIGILTGLAGEVPTLHMMVKQVRLQGLIVGSRQHQKDMVRALEAHPAVRPVIDRSFPLGELAEAFRYEEGATHFGKICVEI